MRHKKHSHANTASEAYPSKKKKSLFGETTKIIRSTQNILLAVREGKIIKYHSKICQNLKGDRKSGKTSD